MDLANLHSCMKLYRCHIALSWCGMVVQALISAEHGHGCASAPHGADFHVLGWPVTHSNNRVPGLRESQSRNGCNLVFGCDKSLSGFRNVEPS